MIYTLVGSLLMLVGAVAIGVIAAEHDGGHHITFVLTALQALALLATARRSGSSCASPPPSW